MLKISFAIASLLLLVPISSGAQSSSMAQRMEASCTGYCHGPSLIAQQRLDRNAWVREVDKMMRWGAEVPPAEKDELINYLTSLFNASRPRPNTSKVVPDGKGQDVFRISCMSCHDDKPVTTLKRDRASWTREVEKMINWGAWVPTGRKDELIDYLVKSFSNS